MRQKRRFRKFGIVFLGLLLAWGGLTVLFAVQYLRPVGLPSGPRPSWLVDRSIPYDGYSILSWSSAAGWGKGDVAYILVHGYGGRRDEQLVLAERLKDRAYVCIPVMAGQGPSEAKRVGFSVDEADELIAVARWIRLERGEKTRVVLVGMSLGGAACWTAAGKAPELFHAVITDSAFARLDWATDDFMGMESPIRRLFSGPVIGLSTQMSGLRIAEVRPVDWAAKYRGRGLIVQGGDDEMFRTRHAEALRSATGLPVWYPEGVGHADAAQKRLDEYVRRILRVVESARPLDEIDSELE